MYYLGTDLNGHQIRKTRQIRHTDQNVRRQSMTALSFLLALKAKYDVISQNSPGIFRNSCKTRPEFSEIVA